MQEWLQGTTQEGMQNNQQRHRKESVKENLQGKRKYSAQEE